MEYAILFCQNVWKQPWVQIHIHVVYFFPVLVEVLKCHQVNEPLVFGSSWMFCLAHFVAFYFLSHFFIVSCRDVELLTFWKKSILVLLLISLYLYTTDFQPHWAGTNCKNMLLTFFSPVLFFLNHVLSQEFSSLQDYETIKMKKIGSFGLHWTYSSWLMLSESHAQSGFRQCSNISRVSITPLSAVTVPGLGEGGHIFLLMQTS